MDQDQFVKRYHKAMVLANKENLEKVKAKVASQWVKDWAAEIQVPIEDQEEFIERFSDFLTDELGFASDVGVTINDDVLSIDVGGCSICPANEELRKSGEPTLCPILSTGLMAISRVLGKNATLLGVDKEGKQVGFCTINYRIAAKK